MIEVSFDYILPDVETIIYKTGVLSIEGGKLCVILVRSAKITLNAPNF
jgi:hypothetical protein